MNCKAENCERVTYARRFCKKHYAQTLRHGRLTPETERGVIRTCAAPDCQRTNDKHDFARGYCRKHARQIELFGRLAPETERMFGIDRCSVPGCKADVRAKALCASHYNKRRWREKGDQIKAQRKSARRKQNGIKRSLNGSGKRRDRS